MGFNLAFKGLSWLITGILKKELQKRAKKLERGKRSEQKYGESDPNLIINHVMRIKTHSVQCVVENTPKMSYMIRT
jgi:hypothetical protein